MPTVDLSKISDRPWPFVRAYLVKQLGLGQRLDSRSDAYALGYLSRATRMDLGKICSRGKPCGNSCVPRKRKCKSETSQLAIEASTKARQKLISELKAERDKKRAAREKWRSPNKSLGRRINEMAQTWEKKAFANAPDDMKRAIAAINDPEVTTDSKVQGNAYFLPGMGSVEMDSYDLNTPRGQSTWRHEFGHHLDWELSNARGTFTSSSAAGRILFDKDRDRLVDDHNKVAAQYQELFERNRDSQIAKDLLSLPNADKVGMAWIAAQYAQRAGGVELDEVRDSVDYSQGFQAIEKHLDGVYEDLPEAYKEVYSRMKDSGAHTRVIDSEKLLRMGRYQDVELLAEFSDRLRGGNNVQDLVGSLTRNKVSRGHDDNYYAVNESRAYTEAFANLTDLHGSGDKLDHLLAQHLAPKGYEYFKRRLEYAASRKV